MRRNFTLPGQTHVSQLRASHPQDASPRLPWIPQQTSKNRVIIITLRGCLSIHSTLVTLRGLQTASNRIPGAIRTFWRGVFQQKHVGLVRSSRLFGARRFCNNSWCESSQSYAYIRSSPTLHTTTTRTDYYQKIPYIYICIYVFSKHVSLHTDCSTICTYFVNSEVLAASASVNWM